MILRSLLMFRIGHVATLPAAIKQLLATNKARHNQTSAIRFNANIHVLANAVD